MKSTSFSKELWQEKNFIDQVLTCSRLVLCHSRKESVKEVEKRILLEDEDETATNSINLCHCG
tara:strand:+ start:1823 stop:2011 length:189 start_codon:yes stop_codon:yes gene_type:complete